MKIILSLLFVCMFTSVSYGASEDIYLRRDVFEAKMDALIIEVRADNEKLHREISELRSIMNAKFDAIETRLNDIQTYISWRIADTQTIVYWGLAGLGLLIAIAAFGPSLLEYLKSRKPAVTLEDVKRLIAESKIEAK